MSPQRILVIRGGAMGDFILTLPALRLLREAHPRARLEIIAYERYASLALAAGYADGVRSIEYGPMAGFFNPKSELNEELAAYFASFDLVISYLFDPDGYFAFNLARAGVQQLLSILPQIDDSRHAALQLAEPLSKIGIFAENLSASLRISPPSEDLPPIPPIALHPGSGSPRKNWPVDRWIQLVRELKSQQPTTPLLFVGGESDEPQLAALDHAFPNEALRVNRPLVELASLLQTCSRFIGHDSGISHLAAATGIEALCLFGPTDPSVWAPLGPRVQILEAPEGDLENLTVETVLRALLGKA